jgi:nicotinamidase-related amidase
VRNPPLKSRPLATFDIASTALVLMDFQNYGVHLDGYWAKRDPVFFARLQKSGAVANAAQALHAARRARLRVIHVVNRWRPGHIDMDERMPVWAGRRGTDVAVEGTWGAEIIDSLTPAPDEAVVVKRSVSAFAGTELARLLVLWGVRTVVLAGVATNFVVEGTGREAADLGYQVIVLGDATETQNDDWQRFSLQIMAMVGTVMTVDQFVTACGV